MDTDGDNYINAREIEIWIMKNVRVHLDDAIKDNSKVFKHLDADRDGEVATVLQNVSDNINLCVIVKG